MIKEIDIHNILVEFSNGYIMSLPEGKLVAYMQINEKEKEIFSTGTIILPVEKQKANDCRQKTMGATVTKIKFHYEDNEYVVNTIDQNPFTSLNGDSAEINFSDDEQPKNKRIKLFNNSEINKEIVEKIEDLDDDIKQISDILKTQNINQERKTRLNNYYDKLKTNLKNMISMKKTYPSD
jgi:hypothetical protein